MRLYRVVYKVDGEPQEMYVEAAGMADAISVAAGEGSIDDVTDVNLISESAVVRG